jgi:small subunit ribosomal protein S17e
MGNIRQTYVKRVAIELVRQNPEAFTEDYTHNRKMVLELTDLWEKTPDGRSRVRFKKLANRIAGYATRYSRRVRRAG